MIEIRKWKDSLVYNAMKIKEKKGVSTMHNLWCGKECSNCRKPCKTDMSMSCSPDCEHLSGDGTECLNPAGPCDALKDAR